jgi:hypothetical protein
MAATAEYVRRAHILYALADSLESRIRSEDLVLCSPE